MEEIGRSPPPVLVAQAEQVEPGIARSLMIRRRTMSLREALTITLAKPDEERLARGIGLHTPIRVTTHGRP